MFLKSTKRIFPTTTLITTSKMKKQNSVAYGSHPFQQKLDSLIEGMEADGGVKVVCFNLGEEGCQEFVSDLVEATGMSLHQVDAEQLESGRGIETQGNLREIFDTTTGEPAVLFFDNADILFKKPAEDVDEDEDRDEDDGALRPIDYLFDRMDAFKGVVVLAISSGEYLEHAREKNVDMVVTA